MSKLNVDQKTIKDLFQDKKADFLIPDYQRPYAWGETECQTLWDDIFSFAIPDEGRVEFDSNTRPITKSMLAWWAFQDDLQELISLETVLEIEHIYARNRFDKDKSLSDVKNLEAIGNKALLEKRINIRAADYRFSDKIKYYQGFTNSRNQKKEGTKNHELISLATAADFTEDDIRNRTRQIMTAFLTFLSENSLTK